MIHVNLYATFRLAAGVKTIELDLPGSSSIFSAVLRITERYPMLRRHWLDQAGELHAHVHIFCNGEDVTVTPAGLQTELQPGDTLDFFPPVAGG